MGRSAWHSTAPPLAVVRGNGNPAARGGHAGDDCLLLRLLPSLLSRSQVGELILSTRMLKLPLLCKLALADDIALILLTSLAQRLLSLRRVRVLREFGCKRRFGLLSRLLSAFQALRH